MPANYSPLSQLARFLTCGVEFHHAYGVQCGRGTNYTCTPRCWETGVTADKCVCRESVCRKKSCCRYEVGIGGFEEGSSEMELEVDNEEVGGYGDDGRNGGWAGSIWMAVRTLVCDYW